jgi:hypothetical protein
MHGALVSAEVILHLAVQNESVENGAQNQVILTVPLEKGPKGPFPEAPVGRIEKGEHLAPGEFLLLSLHFEAEGEGPAVFIEKGGEGRPSGQVLPAEDFFFFFPPGKGPESAEEMQDVFIFFQGRMGQKFPQWVLGKADESEAEEKELVFYLVPLLLGLLEQGLVFRVLGVLGKKKAGVQKGFQPFFLDGFVFLQGLKESGRGKSG